MGSDQYTPGSFDKIKIMTGCFLNRGYYYKDYPKLFIMFSPKNTLPNVDEQLLRKNSNWDEPNKLFYQAK